MLQEVRRGYRGLQRVTRGQKGYSGYQEVTTGYRGFARGYKRF